MNRLPTRLLCAGVIAVGCASASAQGTTPTDHPKAVGVSQETADAANRAAIRDGSTATVVRTGPSAADKASDAATSAKHAASKTRHKVKADTKSATDTDAKP